jgi:hypothetical protein
MKNYYCFLLPLALVILSAGCASNRAAIGAWRSVGFSPTPADKIALAVMPHPSKQDEELGRVLIAELESKGFNIVPQAEADYTLAYAVEDDWTVSDVSVQPVQPPATPPTVVVVPSRFGAAIIQPLPEIERTILQPVVFYTKGIRLYLYSNPKNHPGDLQTAWEGCIDAGQRMSARREPILVKTLLNYFGQDHIGRVSLAE